MFYFYNAQILVFRRVSKRNEKPYLHILCVQRGRGLWKAWSNYGRVVYFWYFQDFKWAQKRTITHMPTEIDENVLFTP